MLFNTIDYLLFLPIVFVVFICLPQKIKNMWLLLSSYFFYGNWNAKYVLLLFSVTIVAYIAGILVDKYRSKLIEGIAIGMLVSLLFYFKYFNMLISTANRFMTKQIPLVGILLPVGISFYIFQAIGYLIDVYRKDVVVEKNFITFALFISFFPQLVAGPIERASNLIPQIKKDYHFEYENVVNGMVRILWGLFMKIVIADRAAVVVDTVSAGSAGVLKMIAAVLFAIQIYCDFGGYSMIAIGTAQMFNVRLMENFQAPYFATNVKDFWTRWHKSLSLWFRDYVYIPLGGNRKGKIRKHFNVLITMLISGLWHGASWNFVFWGGIHGVYQIMNDISRPIIEKVSTKLGLKKDTMGMRVIHICTTFIFVDLAWIFFRIPSFKEGCLYIKTMFTNPQLYLLFRDPKLYFEACGLDIVNWCILVVAVLIMTLIDYVSMHVNVLKMLREQNTLERWLVYIGLTLAIIIFGYYGYDFQQTRFIYFQF